MADRGRLRARAGRLLAGLGVAILGLAVVPTGIGRAAGVVVNLRCGDVAGLLNAMANATPGMVIRLNTDKVSGCTYTLTVAYALDPHDGRDYDGLPLVRQAMTIDGHGSTIARAASSPVFRIIDVDTSGTLTLLNTTISGGAAHNGGGINNWGVVRVDHGIITGNGAPDGGGGISNGGSLGLANSTVSSNYSDYGGGIISGGSNVGSLPCGNDGSLTNLCVTDSTISGNTNGVNGGGSTYGGGILDVSGTAKIMSSVVSGNTAIGGGGIAFFSGDTLTITNSSISSNEATGCCVGRGLVTAGGGIYIACDVPADNGCAKQGSVTLLASHVLDNRSVYISGGGIDKEDGPGTAVAVLTTFSGNTPDNCSGIVVGCRG